jgi:MFS transporter, PPP family, 3-phenylpropionic acid transporter
MNHMMERGRGLRPVIRGALFYGSLFAAIGIYEPYANIYFSNLGLDGTQIGLLGALIPLSQLVYGPFFSSIADRKGKRVWMLALTLFAAAAALLLLSIPRTFGGILVVMALAALFRGPIAGLSDGLGARMAVRHNLDFGRMRVAGSIGFAVFSILFGFIWNQYGYGGLFIATATAYAIVGVAALLLDEAPAVPRGAAYPWTVIRHSPVLRTLLLASFLMGGAIFMAIVFTGMFMVSLGGGENMVGLVMGIPGLIEIPLMLSSGWIMRRIGGMRMLLIGYGLIGAGMLGSGLSTNPAMLMWFSLLKGPGFALFMVGTVVMVDRHAGEWAATIQSLNSAASFGLAPLIASPVAGLIYDRISPAAVFLTAAGLIGCAMVVMAVGQQAEKRRQVAATSTIL